MSAYQCVVKWVGGNDEIGPPLNETMTTITGASRKTKTAASVTRK